MQPPGFKDLSKPNHVCRLRKAIYGLKKTPRDWYTALKNVFLEIGFHNSKADSSLFITDGALSLVISWSMLMIL
jgi:hypothetical protein